MMKRVPAALAVFIWAGFLFAQDVPLSAGLDPRIEGVYEMEVPGSGKVVLQIYGKEGVLRTLEAGDRAVTIWERAQKGGLTFTKSSERNGTFVLTFLKETLGTETAFRVVNEKAGLDLTGKRISGIADVAADPASPSDRLGYFERHYRKTEYQIPMRDGARLYTQVYAPLDTTEPHPIVLYRTPYGIEPYGDLFSHATVPSLWFAKEGYIIVGQDIRGRSLSEGEFNYLAPDIPDKGTDSDVDESSDAYDTIEWLLATVPNHNGRVGVWGSSYPGFTAAMAAIDAHPAVKAVSPQAPMSDLFLGDDGHHYGAFYLAHYARYSYGIWRNREEPAPFRGRYFETETPDAYAYYLGLGTLKTISSTIFSEPNGMWDAAMAHETYDGYWQARSIYQHLRNITPAMLIVGGWYDAEDLLGTLKTYKTIETHNPGIKNILVMGPWIHSGWNLIPGRPAKMGVFDFAGTIARFQEKVELPFFNYYLKDTGEPDLPEAFVYDTGKNEWRSYTAWPPGESSRFDWFLAADNHLSPGSAVMTGDAYDAYVSDPADPVPYTREPKIRNDMGVAYNVEYFVEDQRFLADRSDVLRYTSEAMREDITVAGPVTAELYVSTTGTDADWVVKVIDVYPDDAPDPADNPDSVSMGGYQRLVRGEIMRGKFRNSFSEPEPFVPGKVTKVAFELPDVMHTFKKGHRIMVQVQSSWFPLFDRNPQTFCNIRKAGAEDFQKATHRVYHSREYPSHVSLNIVPSERME
ncbi:CocE/NonD family hydrolase [bacterium]|nr:CocE/NonD family hydrolase [bacterium]